MRIVAASIALSAMGAAAPAADDPFAGRVLAKTSDCIGRTDGGTMRIIDDRTITYSAVDRRLWRNDLPERCPGLDRDPLLVFEQFGGQLCANDRFRLVDRGANIPGRYCRLGEFTAWDKPPTERTD